MSSIHRPGGPVASTEELPIFVVQGATHNADLARAGGLVNPGLGEIQNKTMEQMKTWVGEFYAKKGTTNGAGEVSTNAGQKVAYDTKSLVISLVGVFTVVCIVL